ncbi:MAG: response regulator [Nevskia sp.]|nr:response regulator [Nevskia sp.]
MTSGPAPLQARVIVVDDELAQMNALCDTLRDQVEEIVGFSSAESALAALHQRRFDLLLTDLMLPQTDGITLLRAAQQIDPDLVAIVMTGAGSIATAVEAMKAGALDYILKPFKLSVILPVLSRALAVRRLRQENAKLQGHVRERTAELELANRELQAANRELEAFSHSVSHDLRAPLRAIAGFAEVLESEHSAQWPHEVRTLFGNITTAARRMNQLISDLLRLSQLGRKPLELSDVDVDGLVREALREAGAAESGRQVELRIGPLPGCRADAALLRQVYINLLSNAFKYTRNRRPAKIEVGSERQGEETVYFVRDNGAGFDMRYADRLFGAFQRLHRAEEFEGTGVGLSLAQRIVQRHGGRIWAQAQPDQGATFFFTLPAA